MTAIETEIRSQVDSKKVIDEYLQTKREIDSKDIQLSDQVLGNGTKIAIEDE